MIYEPAEDSYLLSRNLSKYVKNKSFLDMGTGSGIQAITAVNAKAKSVTAVDVISIVFEDKRIKTIKSDLFAKVKGKFDVIAFNPPYLPNDSREDKESALITSGGKRGYELTLRFLKESLPHLNKEGVLLVIVSSLADQKPLINFIKKNNLSMDIIDKENLFMERLDLWEITRKPQ